MKHILNSKRRKELKGCLNCKKKNKTKQNKKNKTKQNKTKQNKQTNKQKNKTLLVTI